MGSYRKRMIWPSMFSDPHIQRLPVAGFKLFVAHISASDDEGRGDLGVEDWKSFAFAQDPEIDYPEIEQLLALLWEPKPRKNRALVEPYEVDGLVYWYLPKWYHYQSIQSATKSLLPEPKDGKRIESLEPARLLLSSVKHEVSRLLTAAEGLDAAQLREDLTAVAMLLGTLDDGGEL